LALCLSVSSEPDYQRRNPDPAENAKPYLSRHDEKDKSRDELPHTKTKK
jgi:hypothetical protein